MLQIIHTQPLHGSPPLARAVSTYIVRIDHTSAREVRMRGYVVRRIWIESPLDPEQVRIPERH